MTQKDKELLLKDLCARLPYGVKVWYKYETWYSKKFATSIRLADEKIALSSKLNKEGDWFPIEEAGEILIKPYLRPLSSMTEEEEKEYKHLVAFSGSPDGVVNFIDWLNNKMFAYHTIEDKDMFKLGLAIKAPEGMYK